MTTISRIPARRTPLLFPPRERYPCERAKHTSTPFAKGERRNTPIGKACLVSNCKRTALHPPAAGTPPREPPPCIQLYKNGFVSPRTADPSARSDRDTPCPCRRKHPGARFGYRIPLPGCGKNVSNPFRTPRGCAFSSLVVERPLRFPPTPCFFPSRVARSQGFMPGTGKARFSLRRGKEGSRSSRGCGDRAFLPRGKTMSAGIGEVPHHDLLPLGMEGEPYATLRENRVSDPSIRVRGGSLSIEGDSTRSILPCTRGKTIRW